MSHGPIYRKAMRPSQYLYGDLNANILNDDPLFLWLVSSPGWFLVGPDDGRLRESSSTSKETEGARRLCFGVSKGLSPCVWKNSCYF